MKKLNKNSIVLALQILPILALGVLSLPVLASAQNGMYYTNYINNPPEYDYPVRTSNPQPFIELINPNSNARYPGAQTVTITGSGFVPDSVAKVNSVNRLTTFIDSSHLLVQINAQDTYRTDGGFYITVSNPAPGGGSSNAAFFTVTPPARPAPVNTYVPVNTVPASNPNYNPYANAGANAYYGYNSANTNYNYNTPAPGNYYDPNAPYYPANTAAPANVQSGYTAGDLAANAVYGTNSFLPSGIIQWILFAIFILVIVILFRRISGARERYQAAPLKHS